MSAHLKMACFLLVFSCFTVSVFSKTDPDLILGHWMSVQGNVKVLVFKQGSEYKAKILWFKDTDDRSKPMSTRTDEKNSDPKLRGRKVLGMEVLSNLRYNSKSQRWEDGQIYDPKTGRVWSSVASLSKRGLLNVKGYWQFEFIGKTMSFRRLTE